MTHAIVFLIFNHLVVNKPFPEMMVSSFTVKLILTFFLNSGSFSLPEVI